MFIVLTVIIGKIGKIFINCTSNHSAVNINRKIVGVVHVIEVVIDP